MSYIMTHKIAYKLLAKHSSKGSIGMLRGFESRLALSFEAQ